VLPIWDTLGLPLGDGRPEACLEFRANRLRLDLQSLVRGGFTVACFMPFWPEDLSFKGEEI